MQDLQDSPLAQATLAELGDEDYSAADFFESYAAKIEGQGEPLDQGPASLQARAELGYLLDYFYPAPPDVDYRLWPHKGLRVLAMLAPIEVAVGILGVPFVELQGAIRSQRPNKPWEWWHALGRSILSDSSTIAEDYGLTPRAVRTYTLLLIGEPWEKAS
jgi:hypothetical protein